MLSAVLLEVAISAIMAGESQPPWETLRDVAHTREPKQETKEQRNKDVLGKDHCSPFILQSQAPWLQWEGRRMGRKSNSRECVSVHTIDFSLELQAEFPRSSLASPFFTLVELAHAKMLGAVALTFYRLPLELGARPLGARSQLHAASSNLGSCLYLWFTLFSLLPSLSLSLLTESKVGTW